MKISYNWLKEYINVNLPVDEVSKYLTDTGLEVEGVEEVESIKGGFKGVVIGEVLTCEQHPNADRLRKTTVNIGIDAPLDIVCGAPNVAAGQKVVVATVGTIIYTDDDSFEIKKSKIRGEVSEGMICAEDELGLGQSHDGIMVLPKDAVVGTPAAEYFKVESDFVIEIGLTPNRTDAMSHYGVARDLRAVLLRHGHQNIEANLPSVSTFSVDNNSLKINIKVENTEACPQYAGVSISGVKFGPSPEWLQNKLRVIGVGPINNVVDITNYVLHETGHPLHAFDAAQIAGNTVIVKTANEGDTFTTLDDKERKLTADDLMICNTEEGMCIAGVFGGAKSGVSQETTNIFLESAYFDPVYVRKTAKRQALNTDASFRYERGVDPNLGIYALKRAALLIRELAGGEISMEIENVESKKFENHEVSINLDKMNRFFGHTIEKDMVHNILNWLDIRIKAESGNDLILSIPPYRVDVTRPADVYEEILRIYGFNAIPLPEKINISVSQDPLKKAAALQESISTSLVAKGFNEIMNNSLTKGEYFTDFGFKAEDNVEMLNPLSRDLSAMRQSLLFPGLENVSYNNNRQRNDLQFFEWGKTYQKTENGYKETSQLALFTTGESQPENWMANNTKTSIFKVREAVEFILSKAGLGNLPVDEYTNPIYDYALSYNQGKKAVVTVGKVSAKLLKQMDIKQDVFYAELDWKTIARTAEKQKVQFAELPKFPEVRRDLALLLDKNVKYSDLKKFAEKSERKLLKDVNLFDVYEGKNLPEGKKSYAVSFLLRDDNTTLNDKAVDKVMDKLLSGFQKQFGAELR